MSDKDFSFFMSRVFFDEKKSCFVWRKGHPKADPSRSGMKVGTTWRGYSKIFFKGYTYSGHRVVWRYLNGKWPVGSIDHIDGNTSNNHPSNLRDVSIRDNLCNKKIHRLGRTPGARKIILKNGSVRWNCEVSIKSKSYHIGRFDSEEESHKNYLKAVKTIKQRGLDGFLEKYRRSKRANNGKERI